VRARPQVAGGLAGLALAATLAIVVGVRPPASRQQADAPQPPASGVRRSSLAGTEPDGAASAAADGALVSTPALVRLFDYWLSTVGERPIDEIRAQAGQDLDRRLAPRAALQARDLLARYFAFKSALKEQRPAHASSGRGVDVLRAGLRNMQSLRATYFSAAESQALFGPDDDAAALALARMAIEQDTALEPAQRRERLAAFDAGLPQAERAERAAPLAVIRLQQAAEQLRAQGGSEDDVYRMRAAAVSPAAANRLADLDREEAAWQARVGDYLQQREAVLADSLDTQQRARALLELRARLFTADEQRRLGAYEP